MNEDKKFIELLKSTETCLQLYDLDSETDYDFINLKSVLTSEYQSLSEDLKEKYKKKYERLIGYIDFVIKMKCND